MDKIILYGGRCDAFLQKSVNRGKRGLRIVGVASCRGEDGDFDIMDPDTFDLDKVDEGAVRLKISHGGNYNTFVGGIDNAIVNKGKLEIKGFLFENEVGKDIFKFMKNIQGYGNKNEQDWSLGLSVELDKVKKDPFNEKKILSARLRNISLTTVPCSTGTYALVEKSLKDSNINNCDFINNKTGIRSIWKNDCSISNIIIDKGQFNKNKNNIKSIYTILDYEGDKDGEDKSFLKDNLAMTNIIKEAEELIENISKGEKMNKTVSGVIPSPEDIVEFVTKGGYKLVKDIKQEVNKPENNFINKQPYNNAVDSVEIPNQKLMEVIGKLQESVNELKKKQNVVPDPKVQNNEEKEEKKEGEEKVSNNGMDVEKAVAVLTKSGNYKIEEIKEKTKLDHLVEAVEMLTKSAAHTNSDDFKSRTAMMKVMNKIHGTVVKKSGDGEKEEGEVNKSTSSIELDPYNEKDKITILSHLDTITKSVPYEERGKDSLCKEVSRYRQSVSNDKISPVSLQEFFNVHKPNITIVGY